jgi:hypothetical protein
MSTGQHVGLRTEDMIRCPWVVGSCAFAADVTVGRGLSHESSTFGIVAFVVRAAGVPDCLSLTVAGWAAGGLGGESPTLDAWSANRHKLRLGLRCSGDRLILETGTGCDYVTHPGPFVWQGFQFRVP